MTKELTFEQAYERLEALLEKISSETVALEEAIALYEEADELIASCQKRLKEAEQKVEILVKKRGGQMEAEPFTPPRESALQ